MKQFIFLFLFSTLLVAQSIQDKLSKESRSQESHFTIIPHEENYFLPVTYDSVERADRKHQEAKFQISIKKDIVDFEEMSLYFAYTQTSFWQVYDTENSSPFRDTIYSPEIFLDIESSFVYFPLYRFAFVHESNGESEKRSRSWNRAEVNVFIDLDPVLIVPTAWYAMPSESDNEDLQDYYGYGELKAYIYFVDDVLLMLRGRYNTKTHKGFLESNLSIPLNKSFDLMLQYIEGYGEALIDYDQKVRRFGIGLQVTRFI